MSKLVLFRPYVSDPRFFVLSLLFVGSALLLCMAFFMYGIFFVFLVGVVCVCFARRYDRLRKKDEKAHDKYEFEEYEKLGLKVGYVKVK